MAGIGGLSSLLGWTPQQQQQNTKAAFAGGAEGVIKIVLGLLVLDVLLFAGEQAQYLLSQQGLAQ